MVVVRARTLTCLLLCVVLVSSLITVQGKAIITLERAASVADVDDREDLNLRNNGTTVQPTFPPPTTVALDEFGSYTDREASRLGLLNEIGGETTDIEASGWVYLGKACFKSTSSNYFTFYAETTFEIIPASERSDPLHPRWVEPLEGTRLLVYQGETWPDVLLYQGDCYGRPREETSGVYIQPEANRMTYTFTLGVQLQNHDSQDRAKTEIFVAMANCKLTIRKIKFKVQIDNAAQVCGSTSADFMQQCSGEGFGCRTNSGQPLLAEDLFAHWEQKGARGATIVAITSIVIYAALAIMAMTVHHWAWIKQKIAEDG